MITPNGLVFALKPEAPTIRHTFELVARALYYHEHEYRQRWPGTCVIQSPYFLLDDLTRPPGADAMHNMLTAFDAGRLSGSKREFGGEGEYGAAR